MNKGKLIGVIVGVAVVAFIAWKVFGGSAIEEASSLEDCDKANGAWVDTTTEAGCIAAGYEWQGEGCSFPSYCEPVAVEEVPVESVDPENTEEVPAEH